MSELSEVEYLKAYDPKKYDAPIVSVDTLLFTCHEDQLKILLTKRANHPEMHKWGLPGGFIDLSNDENIEASALRKLKEKTGVLPPYLELLTSVGSNSRDKRYWSISIIYSALIAHQACEPKISDVSDAQWFDVSGLKSLDLAFDHASIIEQGRERLKQKALYSIVPGYALPEKFTLSQLQRVHELAIGKSITKASFRRRIDQAELLEETGDMKRDSGRPAALYRMKDISAKHYFVRNLDS